MLVIIVAALLRFWQLGDIPPGLYRDEAANGLDALDVLEGRRAGQNPFYFATNNGREPLYIDLTTLFTSLMGRSVEAVRIGAAVVGTLTTVIVYLLADSWFGRRVGLLSAWIWAITVWPVHISRIGLRPVMLPLMLGLSLWLGTIAYRRRRDGLPSIWLWLLGGLVYGLSFYSYLAVRISPIFLAAALIYLLLTKRHKPLWPGILWFLLGTLVVATPLILLAVQEPELMAGRLDQVSILNSAVNEGSLVGALWHNTWRALGLFFVKGDTIVRHNPSGRALFDISMLVPFMIGLLWCIRQWRRTLAVLLFLWIGIMLAPTIFAEDTPHFLRAVGILPAVVILPAIGLSQLLSWSKLPSHLGLALVIALSLASLGLTIKDYFFDYGHEPETRYWFESAARSLAEDVNNDTAEGDVYLDRRFWDGWLSVRYLLESPDNVNFYQSEEIQPGDLVKPAPVYAWPHDNLARVAAAIVPPALVSAMPGELAQGDLDPEPYLLYARYGVDNPVETPILASFDNTIQLRHAEVHQIGGDQIQVDLYWSADNRVDRPIVSFIHVIEGDTVVAQSDSVPSNGFWPSQWWRPKLVIDDRHILEIDEDAIERQHQIKIGLYDANTLEPLLVTDSNGNPIGETWQLR
jgi:4-amino-4-deoxy-L-arabinose transferase-like glycosyltransferase